jgi:hypothetical protein
MSHAMRGVQKKHWISNTIYYLLSFPIDHLGTHIYTTDRLQTQNFFHTSISKRRSSSTWLTRKTSCLWPQQTDLCSRSVRTSLFRWHSWTREWYNSSSGHFQLWLGKLWIGPIPNGWLILEWDGGLSSWSGSLIALKCLHILYNRSSIYW